MSCNRIGVLIVIIMTSTICSCNPFGDPPPPPKTEPTGTFTFSLNKEKSTESNLLSSRYYYRDTSFSYSLLVYMVKQPHSVRVEIMVSAPREMEIDKRYVFPLPESEGTWWSEGKINDKKVKSGWLKFTDFNTKGELDKFGRGDCDLAGVFEMHAEDGTVLKCAFDIDDSFYWDVRGQE